MTAQELLKSDETFNRHVDEAIAAEGKLKWLERMLTENKVEYLMQKKWYPEVAYVLHRMDEICREYELPLLEGSDHWQIRRWQLFTK